MSDKPTVPKGPLLLGWAGVIPFAGLAVALLLHLSHLPLAPAPALVAYGACILSFMGGAQWGLAMRADESDATKTVRYAISVLPALLGWACLLLPTSPALVGLAAGFALLLAYDLSSVRAGLAPAWYRSLRIQLTTAVVVLLGASALL